MKHTEGPWEIGYGNGITGETCHIIPEINLDGEKLITHPVEGLAGGTTDGKILSEVIACVADKANAKLIAAAPDLLEACKEAKEYFDQTADVDDGIPNEEMNLLVGITQVINKAEGKE